MEIPNLKRWQWAGIGVVLGGLLSLPHVLSNPGDRYVERRTLTAQRFLFNLSQRGMDVDLPSMRHVTIYPPVTVHRADGKTEQDDFVTAEWLDELLRRPPAYVAVSAYMPDPLPATIKPQYDPRLDRASAITFNKPTTLREYLDQLKRAGNPIDYRFAWWDSPLMALLYWVVGTTLIFGGIWPSVLKWSRRGQADTEADVAIPLFGKRGSNSAQTDSPGGAGSRTSDQTEPWPGAPSSTEETAGIAIDQPVAATSPVAALSAGPLEQVAPTANEEEKEYDGEYYPVAHPHDPAHRDKPQKGFSLVELLVVIGLIALLISLLMPALSKARRQSQTIACQSNLRQIGIALQIYENDNRGWFFPCIDEDGVPTGMGVNLPPNERWPMKVFKVAGAPNPPPFDPNAYVMDPWDPIGFPAEPYTPPVMRCPADLDPADAHSYMLNHHLIDKRLKAGSHDFGGLTSSQVILGGEKVSTRRDYLMQYGDYDKAAELYRHGLDVGSNYLFLDCHAATLLPGDAIGGIDPWDVKGKDVTVSE